MGTETTELASEIRLQNCPPEECEPVTLQVVLRGSDGVVIASDTCKANVGPRGFRSTEPVSKIRMVNSTLVYTFAGDDCARDVGAAVAEAANTAKTLSNEFIDEVSNKALAKYKTDAREIYRKIIWVKAENAGFEVFSAFYRGGRFVADTHPEDSDGRCNVYAGDDVNLATYIVERYYKRYPLRRISSLKKLAAHMILTGETFSGSVSGLEMVASNSNGFEWVPREEIQELVSLSNRIHEENDFRFKGDQNSVS